MTYDTVTMQSTADEITRLRAELEAAREDAQLLHEALADIHSFEPSRVNECLACQALDRHQEKHDG